MLQLQEYAISVEHKVICGTNDQKDKRCFVVLKIGM